MKSHQLPRDVERVAHSVMEQLNTPISLGVYLQMIYGEWDELARRKLDPCSYDSAASYLLDASAVSLLKKAVFLPGKITEEVRRQECKDQFFVSECRCAKTNVRLGDLRIAYGYESPRLLSFVEDVRKVIRHVLKRLPNELNGKFGPGATFDDKGCLATVGDKMTSVPTLYPESTFVEPFWGETTWRRALQARRIDPEIVRGNRFTTVAKDATRNRGICVEASISGFYQLGVGLVIRDRLKSVGIDLDHGQETHVRVAREASIHGGYSTIDLRNASDTVSYELVKLLLPEEWFDLLDWLRAPFTRVDGSWVKLEKFSSMGNGYTFELETLIFYAICRAMQRRHIVAEHSRVLVYGDDIIVPSSMSKDVISALAYFGFETNNDKTFVDGPFRESCGGDFYEGVDVRPYFIKEEPCEPQDFIKLANGLRRLSRKINCGMAGVGLLRNPWLRALDCIPAPIRACRGPEELGDIVIHDDPERLQSRTRSSIRYFRCYRPARYYRVGWKHFFPEVQLACGLLGQADELGGRFPERGLTPRDAVTGYKIGWVPSS